jgi:DNA-binding phage protein
MPTIHNLSEINAALAVHDLAPLKAAILEFGQQENFREFAKLADVNRENLYRTLRSDAGFRTDHLFKLLDTMGLKLRVVPRRRQQKARR